MAVMAKIYSKETRARAKNLFVRGWNMEEIRDELRVGSVRLLYYWREADAWDDAAPASTVEEAMARRICLLVEKEGKSDRELNELDLLTKRLLDLQTSAAKSKRLAAMPADMPLLDGAPEPRTKERRSRDKRQKKVKNDISEVTSEMLDEIRNKLFFPYQKRWWEVKQDKRYRRTRFILKSRQIGATYYFAWEALEDAIKTGDNQIFLSASRDQAEVFRAYMVAFAKNHLGIELTGSPITLSNDAELRFLSTNSRTAQSYHGHLYLDEVFWIPNFKKLWDIASGMSTHKKWRRTLFSTPSALSHEAYPMWSGEQYNKRLPEKNRITFDLSHKALVDGWLGPDRIWRNIVTIDDALASGFDEFDIDDLKLENSEEAYACKYLCKFIDDAQSVFPLSLLLACCVDTDTWKDYKPNTARPLGNAPVAGGYDPNGEGNDSASLTACSVPIRPIDKWRVLKRQSFRKQSMDFQANRIRETGQQFNLVHMGIDATGIGWGVSQLVQDMPQVMQINYSPQMKTQLVMKGLSVMEAGRLEIDVNDKVLLQSFLMIKKTLTESGGQVTYKATRSVETGHADAAWSVLNALIYEPIDTRGRGTTVAFSN